MNTTNIIAALLVSAIIILTGCIKPTFTARIIENDDGTYTTEYYFPKYNWHVDPNAFHVSLEKAKSHAENWNNVSKHKGPKIVK